MNKQEIDKEDKKVIMYEQIIAGTSLKFGRIDVNKKNQNQYPRKKSKIKKLILGIKDIRKKISK